MGEQPTDWSCGVCPLIFNHALPPVMYSAIQKRIVWDRGENRWSERAQEKFGRGECFWNSVHLFYLRFIASLARFANVKWKLSIQERQLHRLKNLSAMQCHVCRWGLLEDNAQGGKWLTLGGYHPDCSYLRVCVSSFFCFGSVACGECTHNMLSWSFPEYLIFSFLLIHLFIFFLPQWFAACNLSLSPCPYPDWLIIFNLWLNKPHFLFSGKMLQQPLMHFNIQSWQEWFSCKASN